MKPLKYLIATLIAIAIFGGGLYAGYRVFKPAPMTTVVNAQVILTALRERGFLVTQTFVFDEPVTIKKTTGSALEDFFLGQTITARGAMEVNLGVDLANLSPDDVKIGNDKITVTVPAVKTFNVRLVGPVDVQNKQGIVKRILQNEDGYNESLAELSRVAEEAAKKPELMDRARTSAKEEVARLLGYVAADKNIEILFK